jgi:hypothetical protein
MLATQGYGIRAAMATQGYGSDGRGFASEAEGCVGEVRKPYGAEALGPMEASVARPFGAEAEGPFGAQVVRPFGAEVADGE